jgi:hypothetical protein
MNHKDKQNLTKFAVEKAIAPFPTQIEIAFTEDKKDLENHL